MHDFVNVLMKSTKVQNFLMQCISKKISCSTPMIKVRGLSIESRSCAICIDLSMYVRVVKDYIVSNKPV